MSALVAAVCRRLRNLQRQAKKRPEAWAQPVPREQKAIEQEHRPSIFPEVSRPAEAVCLPHVAWNSIGNRPLSAAHVVRVRPQIASLPENPEVWHHSFLVEVYPS